METFILKQVINKFSQKGYNTPYSEILKLHQITLFNPIKLAYLNPIEIKIALKSLIFLVLKI